MKAITLLAALAPAALLAGCATPARVSPVEVTRFSEPRAVLGSGSIAVRPAPGEPPDSWDFSVFRTAVAAELAKLGYTVAEDGAQQVALVSVRRAVGQPATGAAARSPVSVGVGGSTGSYGSGVGLGVGIDLGDLGGGRPTEEIDTELRVSILPSGGANALWEGRARFTATSNSEFADRSAAAGKLAGALFAGFPGRSGETIEVR